ncbi:MAG: general secretion pathway protein GspD [Planctomycetes bacterium]|nr:general secretion pathway protein GspD [Planctomycetota bacterium]
MPYATAFAEGGAGHTKPAASLTRAEVDNLLIQARSAMATGKLDEADALVRRAEASKARYPLLHFGDTPARVRTELSKLTGGSKKSKAGNPLSRLLAKSAPDVKDPFAAAALLTDSSQMAPRTTNTTQAATTQIQPPRAMPQQSARQLSDAALLAARQALAVGDATSAKQFLAQAMSQSVEYSPAEDSPQRVTQSINDFELLSSNKDESASWRQGYTKFLVSQASALANWGDLEGAERTANEAAALSADIKVQGTTPSDVLRLVHQLRAGPASLAPTPKIPTSLSAAKAETTRLLAEARLALGHGDLRLAETLAAQASRLGVADSTFAHHEDRPSKLAADLQLARTEMQQMTLASEGVPVDLALPAASGSSDLELSPRLAQLPEIVPTPLPPPAERPIQPADAFQLIKDGERALREGNRRAALELFRTAYEQRDQLDPLSVEQLQGHLHMLSGNAPTTTPRPATNSLLNAATTGQTLVARQLSAEIGKRQSEASRLRRDSNPKRALEVLNEGLGLIAKSELDEGMKNQLNRRVQLSIAETEKYISDHRAEIELDEANREVLEDIDRQREVKQQVRERMAELVDQYNTLRNEQRYADMEVVAKRLFDLAPKEPVAQQVWANAKFIRREMLNNEIREMTEEGVARSFLGIREDAGEALLHSDQPIRYDPEKWSDVVGREGSSPARSRRTARELEIERKLRTQVLPKYENMPLSEVIHGLSDLAGVNIHLDARGLGQEAVESDAPISLSLGQEISLESALNLILEPLHLAFMIKDDVIKITSEQLSDGERYIVSYNVADLVIPIPNFVPSTNMGLQGLINDAYAAIPHQGQAGGIPVPGPIAVANGGRPDTTILPNGGMALAQQMGAPGSPSASAPLRSGPGGLGGAASADFDSLIDLIVSTVAFDSWMENGTGEGEIQPFPTNLSLVISQTQRVHEEIADLLEQLRRLQDLQVTIEVRFIRLTDSFFERIGVDFDFNIRGANGNAITAATNALTNSGPSATVGISTNPIPGLGNALPTFTADLDVPFRNESSTLAAPAFGTPADVGSFGFAILSDIEAFFLINASQGDRRANVLQAPKVTLFNGQLATVVDASFVPFVISVIPVVGEFAAAQQPVIVVLSEGTTMTVQAVVSDDRRYVRLTIVPFFSQIGEVRTFTFEGSETTISSSETTDPDDDGNNDSDASANQTIRSGTTVQLPTFQLISVSTTVSVPDGGTVLLGGIKRLREGRNEFGVPLIGKVPYLDRLFRNVGIGRETDSLMMMVTPHIIIQEEEEERLGITSE